MRGEFPPRAPSVSPTGKPSIRKKIEGCIEAEKEGGGVKTTVLPVLAR